MSRLRLPGSSFPIPRLGRAAGFLVAAATPASVATAQQLEWLEHVASPAIDSVETAASDASGDVFFGGETRGALFGPHAGQGDVWVARHDAAGNAEWTRQFGTSDVDLMRGATADGAGGVYVCGVTRGALGGPNAGGDDAWLARLDGTGQVLWTRQLGNALQNFAMDAAPDGAGGVFVGGSTQGSLGGPGAGGHDAWLAHYDATSDLHWILQYGSSAPDSISGMAADGAGGVLVSGTTAGALGGPSAGFEDAWIARYDASGDQLWRTQLGTPAFDYLNGAAPDGAGGIYVGGLTYGPLGGPSVDTVDAWLGRLDSNGAVLWLRQIGSIGWDEVREVSADGSGGAFLGGVTLGSLAGTYQGDGLTTEAWLARYDAAGNELWSEQFGTIEYEQLEGLAPDGAGGVYAGGMTEGDLAAPVQGLSDGWIARWSDGCPAVLGYCAPSATSIPGCAALLSTSGVPKASVPLGFTIQATGAPSGAPAFHIGLCLFAANGQASIPFGTLGGAICVQPPAFRSAGKLSGGGIVPCDGGYAFTLQDLAHKSPIVVSGTTIQAQVWARDTANPDGFLLSDAVEFAVCP